jgi:hypothetical protein
MIGDVERLSLIQRQVIKLRRLAAETSDNEIAPKILALADELEHRTREADRQRCSPK